LVSAQKGAVAGMIRVEGKPCHSGYPHLGVDANAILVSIANALYRHNFGSDAELGTATVNIGKISGGVAPNIVSPMAELDFWVRTVGKASEVEKDVNKIIASSREKHLDAKIFLDVKSTSEPFHFHIVTGFPTVVVAYGSDAPYLGRSGARCLMFGPGSITLAHTDHEYVELAELASAFEDYKTLYAALSPAE
jgi:acetylornithine deacetylase